ncbi:hypothetical protein P4S68_01015 [Pseudoalteromonas sp. Hal099]
MLYLWVSKSTTAPILAPIDHFEKTVTTFFEQGGIGANVTMTI